MPNYCYSCESCNHNWECFLPVTKREEPTEKPCPKCNEQKVIRDWSNTTLSISSDMTLTPDKATGGRWGELMNKMKAGMPSRYGKKLDSPQNMTGKRWYS